ncbi:MULTISPECIES: flagellar basal body-associated protein FliL [unclassified Motilimonas]|uniref:flagellar basal body-associated protein FliL n=1 Tax=Motilimonas TaxID=1914248 RepID=UPI001E5B8FEE|nr:MULTISPECIES: flagellar basal body-associated protein FliL [unclassified Motilimonas]MCE0556242.1 flagellar basal body-associated protein FliL [Motilimonas sp. E26]MDO6524982.1 flagellar basal body-associated protein FliL [Motilimonas sp. 1_MG-2023]
MADEANENLELNEKKGGKGKLIIIIVAVVVLLAGGGGAAYFFLAGSDEAAATEGNDSKSTAPKVDASTLKAIYVGMPRAFVFNVAGDGRDRLVQIKVQLMVRGVDNENLTKMHIPLIEGTLLSVFSAATEEELRSESGKSELRKKSLQEVQKAMNEVASAPTVEAVLFTGFVLQ